jgi:cytochrome b561
MLALLLLRLLLIQYPAGPASKGESSTHRSVAATAIVLLLLLLLLLLLVAVVVMLVRCQDYGFHDCSKNM